MPFREAMRSAVDDMFVHLGVGVTFRSTGIDRALVAVIRQPERPYDLGDTTVVRGVVDVSIKAADATPRIGDFVVANGKTYKIYEEPLLETYSLIWRFNAVQI